MPTTDPQFQLLIDMNKEMAINTDSTKKIEEHLRTLNGKVADSRKDISRIKTALTIAMTAIVVLLITNGSELIKVFTILI